MTKRPPTAVHVGFVKTATSTWQKDVFPNHPDIRYLGLPAPDAQMDALIHAIAQQDSMDFDAELAKRTVDERALQLEPGRLMLISYENFCLYESRDKGLIATRLHRLFAPCKIVFTIRRQEDLTRAWYLQRTNKYIQGNNLMDMDTWFHIKSLEVHKSILDDLDYDKIISHYEKLFGHENVGVFCFEHLKADRAGYVDAIAGFLDVDPAPMMSVLDHAHKNPTITQRQFGFARWTADYVPNALYRNSGRLIHRKVRSKFSKYLKRSPRARLDAPSAVDDWIREHCREGNRRLNERYGGMLSAHGYCL